MADAPREVSPRPAPSRRLRRRHIVLGILLLVLCSGLGYVFSPSVQRDFALVKAAPFVESIDIDYLHVLPWSLTARGVAVSVKGAHYRIGDLELGFNPLALLAHTVSLRQLSLHGADFDLRNAEPGAPPAGPFPGVLALLDQGYALALGTLDAEALVHLPADQDISAKLGGSGFDTMRTGTVQAAIEYRAPALSHPVEVRATADVAQHNRGRITAFDLRLTTPWALRERAAPEPLELKVGIRPEPEDEATRAAKAENRAADMPLPPAPELIAIEIGIGDGPRATVTIDGRYQGANGQFDAHWKVLTGTHLLQALLGDEVALPELDSTTSGTVALDSVARSGRVALESTTQVSALSRVLGDNPDAPTRCELRAASRASFGRDSATLEQFDVTIDGAGPGTVVAAQLGAPVAVPLENPHAALESERELGTIKLGPLPLVWINGLLPHHDVEGELAGEYRVAIDKKKRVRLSGDQPTTIGALRVAPKATRSRSNTDVIPDPEPPLIEGLSLSVKPTASWSPQFLRYALNETTLEIGGKALAHLDIKAASKSEAPAKGPAASTAATTPTATAPAAAGSAAAPTAATAGGAPPAAIAQTPAPAPPPPPKPWRYRIKGDFDYDTLAAIPVVAAQVKDYPLPAGLNLTFKTLVAQRGPAVSVEKVELAVREPKHPDVLHLAGLKPFHLDLSGDRPRLKNPTGDLATLSTRGIDLAWANPLLKGLVLGGQLASADVTVRAPTSDTLSVSSTAPLKIEKLSLNQDGRAVLRDVSFAASPEVAYAPGNVEARMQSFALRHGGTVVVRGDTVLGLRDAEKKPADGEPATGQTTVQGKFTVNLAQAALQPAVAAALGTPLPAIPITAALDFALRLHGDTIEAQRLHADVAIGKQAHAIVEAEPGLVARTHLGPGQKLAQYVVGGVAFDVKDLSSETLHKFVPLDGISFAEINSSVRVKSDGDVLRITSLAPLGVDDVRMNDGKRETVHEFSLKTDASVLVEQDEIHARLADLALTFSASPSTPALSGVIDAAIVPGRRVPLNGLKVKLDASLPLLLAQPALLPGHRLASGSLSLDLEVDAARKIAARMLLDGLSSSEPLAIQTFELPMKGEVAEDGVGFSFDAPLVGRGKSGTSNAAITARYTPHADAPRVLELELASEVFYLNDILATIEGIRAPPVVVPVEEAAAPSDDRKDKAPRVRIVLNEKPDEEAAWNVLPYSVSANLHIDRLYYSDYVVFNDVGGLVHVHDDKLEFQGVRARFHDSALAVDGVTKFTGSGAQPYDLNLNGTIKDFNLSQFFGELVPGEKPRIEGLFGGEFKAFGQFPNFSQVRNKVLFDLRMQSRDGLFRPLPPDSALLVGVSDMLGIFGEGLSYVPTGGFGAGAIARLVDYIQQIDYDSIDIHVLRDESRNVTIEQFQVASPTILLTARGGITHEEGVDILDAPLELDASLDMLGRGAAILYSMDLMQNERDEQGYWKGPQFRIWGTPSETQSNFDEIIGRAADGATKGGIVRPIAGLIGNLKYRWFDSDSRTREALQVKRRDERESALEASGMLPPAPGGPAAAPPADNAPAKTP